MSAKDAKPLTILALVVAAYFLLRGRKESKGFTWEDLMPQGKDAKKAIPGLKCDMCGKSFSDPNKIVKHFIDDHGKAPKWAQEHFYGMLGIDSAADAKGICSMCGQKRVLNGQLRRNQCAACEKKEKEERAKDDSLTAADAKLLHKMINSVRDEISPGAQGIAAAKADVAHGHKAVKGKAVPCKVPGCSYGNKGDSEFTELTGAVDMETYKVVRSGGSIGEQGREKIVKSGLSKEEAIAIAKQRNAGLSQGEKRYYKIKYSIQRDSLTAQDAALLHRVIDAAFDAKMTPEDKRKKRLSEETDKAAKKKASADAKEKSDQELQKEHIRKQTEKGFKLEEKGKYPNGTFYHWMTSPNGKSVEYNVGAGKVYRQ